MSWNAVTHRMVVYLGDPDDNEQLPVVPGSLTITGSLDDLCRTATFSLADQHHPRPSRSDDIVIRYLDETNSLMYDVFGGKLQRPDTESDPWGQVHVACDQLEKLRKTKRGGDMALSGSGRTEGDAYKLILDYCGVTYDDADIGDSGYVIGLHEPLLWHDDGSTSGAQLISDFDTVFGFKLMTIGNNRVVRIPYDPTPTTSTGSYRTLEKGDTVDWQKHHRGGGTRDQITNVWKVTGASIQINDTCTETVWADAYDSVTELGTGVRPADGTFQSDLIQSEDLAEAVARRLMRINNRVSEVGSGTVGDDPNIYPCTKLTLEDTTYGIGADPRYATVTAYRWTFPILEFDFVAGPPGDEGTVTHGVDKVCNDTHSDVDIPGDGFDFPGFEVPDLITGDALDFTPPDDAYLAVGWDLVVRAVPPGGSYDAAVDVSLIPTFPCFIYYTTDGSTPTTGSTNYTTPIHIDTTTTLKFFGRLNAEHESPIFTEDYDFGGGPEICDTPQTADWVVDSGLLGDWTFLADGDAADVNAGSIHNTGITINDGESWRITTTIDVGANKSVEFGVGSDGLSAQYYVLAYATPSSGDGVDVATLDETQNDPTDLTGSPTAAELTYDAVAATLTLSIASLGIHLVANDLTVPAGPFYPYVRVYDEGGGGLATGGVEDMLVCIGGEGDVLSVVWHTFYGGWSFVDPSEAHFVGTTLVYSGYAYSDGTSTPFDGTLRVRLSGHVELSGDLTDAVWQIGIGGQAEDLVETGVNGSPSAGTTDFYDANGDYIDSRGDVGTSFNFFIDMNPDTDIIRFVVGTIILEATLGSWAASRWPFLACSGNHNAMNFDITNIVVRLG